MRFVAVLYVFWGGGVQLYHLLEVLKFSVRALPCPYKNVTSVDDRNRESSRLLVKERIVDIGKPRILFLRVFGLIIVFFKTKLIGLTLFANQLTVHSGGVSRVRVRGCWH